MKNEMFVFCLTSESLDVRFGTEVTPSRRRHRRGREGVHSRSRCRTDLYVAEAYAYLNRVRVIEQFDQIRLSFTHGNKELGRTAINSTILIANTDNNTSARKNREFYAN